jgi:O-antigen/teichoic acid export membrane protein
MGLNSNSTHPPAELIAAGTLASPEVAPSAAAGRRPFDLLIIILSLGGMQAMAIGVNLLRSKVVALAVGPKGVGVISIIDQIVVLVAQVSLFSLPFAAVKFLSAAHSESHQAFARGYAAFRRILLLISLAGAALASLIALAWPGVLGREISRYKGLLVLGLLTIPAIALTGLLTNTFAAAQRARASGMFGLLAAVALAVFAGGGILWAGLPGYYVGNLVAGFFTIAGGMLYLSSREGLGAQRGISIVKELRRYPAVFSLAGALYITSFTNPIANLVARYSVLQISDVGAAGLLQAAMGLSLALGSVLSASAVLYLMPVMNRNAPFEEKFRAATEFQRVLLVTASVAALPIVLFPRLWVYLLYSREFQLAAPQVYLFVVAQAVLLLSGVNQGLLIGLDRIAPFVLIGLTGDAGVAFLSVLLARRFGLMGVGLAFLLIRLLSYALSCGYLAARYHVFVPRGLGWYPFCALLVVGTAGAAAAHFSVETPAWIAAKAALAILLAVAGLKALGTGPAQILERLRNALGRV